MDCTIKRVKDKTSNFTVVYNELFQRSDVSARAKGIYAYIMTLPDNWKIYKSELYEHFSEGRDSIDKAFKELEKLGYITKERAKNKDGKFDGWNYEIFESLDDTDSLPVDGWSFDAWKKTLKVSGYRHVDGRREYQNYSVDISDLITGKMEVVSPGYKGEVNNEGLES